MSVSISERRRQIGRHSHRGYDNIKIDNNEIVCEDVDWIHAAHDRGHWVDVVSTVMNLRVR